MWARQVDAILPAFAQHAYLACLHATPQGLRNDRWLDSQEVTGSTNPITRTVLVRWNRALDASSKQRDNFTDREVFFDLLDDPSSIEVELYLVMAVPWCADFPACVYVRSLPQNTPGIEF